MFWFSMFFSKHNMSHSLLLTWSCPLSFRARHIDWGHQFPQPSPQTYPRSFWLPDLLFCKIPYWTYLCLISVSLNPLGSFSEIDVIDYKLSSWNTVSPSSLDLAWLTNHIFDSSDVSKVLYYSQNWACDSPPLTSVFSIIYLLYLSFRIRNLKGSSLWPPSHTLSLSYPSCNPICIT